MTMNLNNLIKTLKPSDREMLMTALESGYTDKYVEWMPGRFVGVNITQPGFNIEHQAGHFVEGLLTGHTIPFPVQPTAEVVEYSPFEPFEDTDDDRHLRHGTD